MPPGRLLFMLVVLTASLVVHRPATAAAACPSDRADRSSWTARLGTNVAHGFSRIGLMQRVMLATSAPRPYRVAADAVRVVPTPPDPRLTCLPPPSV